jgi:hypothetical protein
MTPSGTKPTKPLIRYSPRPLSDYKVGAQGSFIGPATSTLLNTAGAWNLAYLSHDYDKVLMHPDPQFTVNVRRTAQMRLDGSGIDLAGSAPLSKLVGSLLMLPAPRFVYLINQHPIMAQLPLFMIYGQSWLKTIEERSHLCQADERPPDYICDYSMANSVLTKFRK